MFRLINRLLMRVLISAFLGVKSEHRRTLYSPPLRPRLHSTFQVLQPPPPPLFSVVELVPLFVEFEPD